MCIPWNLQSFIWKYRRTFRLSKSFNQDLHRSLEHNFTFITLVKWYLENSILLFPNQSFWKLWIIREHNSWPLKVLSFILMYDNTFSVAVSPMDIACHSVVATLVCHLHALHSLLRFLGSLSFCNTEHVLSQPEIYSADFSNCFW